MGRRCGAAGRSRWSLGLTLPVAGSSAPARPSPPLHTVLHPPTVVAAPKASAAAVPSPLRAPPAHRLPLPPRVTRLPARQPKTPPPNLHITTRPSLETTARRRRVRATPPDTHPPFRHETARPSSEMTANSITHERSFLRDQLARWGELQGASQRAPVTSPNLAVPQPCLLAPADGHAPGGGEKECFDSPRLTPLRFVSRP